jgi:type IV pilus assembly protein PilQ
MNFRKDRKLSALLLVLLCLDFLSGTPPALSADGDPSVSVDIDSAAAVDTISMSFDGALLKDVLLLFSQQSGLNFIASQEVETRKVTVYFENVTPRDALDAIVTANGLTYSKKPGSDIFVVYPSTKTSASPVTTKVIRLKYMRLSSSPLDVGGQVTISDLQKSSAPSSSGSGSSSGGGSSGGESSSGSSGGGSATSAMGTSASSSDRGADKIIGKLLSTQGKLTMDLSTNSIIVTDTAESIAQIEKVLAELDVPPTQVILEVYIMEVSKTLLNNIGIEWGGPNGALGTLRGGARTTLFPLRSFGEPDIVGGTFTGDIGGEDGLFITADNTTNAPSSVQYGLIDASNFAATLHFIKNDNKTKILARPRVLTQNNEAAAIKLVTNASIGETTSTSATGASSSEIERSEIGVTMRMTPQINADDTVSLFLEPAVSTVGASQFVADTADPTTRLIRTMARVKNDQTLVIGGLIDSQEQGRRRKVPFLGDLPVIGKGFHYDADIDTDRELLVFVTPHIVRGPSSVGPSSSTAKGEDTAVRRMLDQFMDKEMDGMSSTFEGFEKKRNDFFTKDEQLVRDSERRYSNPAVEDQMTQALDALSPQMVEGQISKTLDQMGGKKA